MLTRNGCVVIHENWNKNVQKEYPKLASRKILLGYISLENMKKKQQKVIYNF